MTELHTSNCHGATSHICQYCECVDTDYKHIIHNYRSLCWKLFWRLQNVMTEALIISIPLCLAPDRPQQCVHFHGWRAPYRWPVRHHTPGLCDAWPAARLSQHPSPLPHGGTDKWHWQYSFSPSVPDARPAAIQNCQLLSVEEPERHKAIFISVSCASNFPWGGFAIESSYICYIFYYYFIVRPFYLYIIYIRYFLTIFAYQSCILTYVDR